MVGKAGLDQTKPWGRSSFSSG